MDIREIEEIISEKFPGVLEKAEVIKGDNVIVVRKDAILSVMNFLKKELSFEMLIDVTAVDYYGKKPRFEVVYQLYSVSRNERLRVKTRVDEGEELDSVFSVWPSASFPEREVYDLFGIKFKGHPYLKRLLLWDGFEGHPLRKDFPVEGYDFDKPFKVE